jgi:LPPG:FO 2-phospho-L-lactate transferase
VITFLSGGARTAELIGGFRTFCRDDELAVVTGTSDIYSSGGALLAPQIDRMLFLFSGLLNLRRLSGITGDSYITHGYMHRLGHDEPVAVGDRERAVGIVRADLLARGHSLTGATELAAGAMDIAATLLPVTDTRVTLQAETPEGRVPAVMLGEEDFGELSGLKLVSDEEPAATAKALACIGDADAVIIAPENPVLTLMPLIGYGGISAVLQDAFVITVLPPAGPLRDRYLGWMKAAGLDPSAEELAALFAGFTDLYIQDRRDPLLLADTLRLDTRPRKGRCEALAWDLSAMIRKSGDLPGGGSWVHKREKGP